MLFGKTVILKDGRECLLRNAENSDAQAYLDYFILAHSETDNLTTYPDETARNIENTEKGLEELKNSPREVEICAFADGKLAGSAGIGLLRDRDKTRHRAEFGISILKQFWGLGIGRALTQSCIECAKNAGYLQLELDVVAENQNAIKLYESCGFKEYGRNPRGFRTREGKWQELVLMRLELDK